MSAYTVTNSDPTVSSDPLTAAAQRIQRALSAPGARGLMTFGLDGRPGDHVSYTAGSAPALHAIRLHLSYLVDPVEIAAARIETELRRSVPGSRLGFTATGDIGTTHYFVSEPMPTRTEIAAQLRSRMRQSKPRHADRTGRRRTRTRHDSRPTTAVA